MRLPIVAGNWKMHGSRPENARLIEELVAQYPADPGADCVVCPPFVYLQEVGRMLRDTALGLGGQDVCADTHGAFTGEVSAAMLKDVGCEYVIVGHSERRLLYRETDQLIARKFAAAHAKVRRATTHDPARARRRRSDRGLGPRVGAGVGADRARHPRRPAPRASGRPARRLHRRARADPSR